jgi:hypothetical protein
MSVYEPENKPFSRLGRFITLAIIIHLLVLLILGWIKYSTPSLPGPDSEQEELTKKKESAPLKSESPKKTEDPYEEARLKEQRNLLEKALLARKLNQEIKTLSEKHQQLLKEQKAVSLPPKESSIAFTSPTEKNLRLMKPAKLYQAVINLEKDAAKEYTRLRAAETVMRQNLAPETALRLDKINSPPRPALERELELTSGRPATMASVRAHQKAAAEAKAVNQWLEQNLDLANQITQRALMGSSLAVGLQEPADRPQARQSQAEPGTYNPSEVGYRPPKIDEKIKPSPGRRIVSGEADISSEWIYIDSWYAIGPFPNDGRSNLTTAFEPETSPLDLDAVYIGRWSRPVKWRFFQSPEPRVDIPGHEPYEIYYLYSEIFSDQDRQVWLASGADDYAKIWLNGTLIWESSRGHKSWIPDETLQKVELKKGTNPVLYRLENGQGPMYFSLWLKTR